MSSKKRFLTPVAVHLFLVRENRVLLLRRYNTGYEDGNWSVPAGHLEGGETVIQAGIREAAEEIGIRLTSADLAPAGVMHRLSDDERIDFFVAATRWEGEVRNMEPDKCDGLDWFPFDALPPNVIPYVRRALQNYREGRWFDLFGWDGAE
jgi:8-oxo-dGTP diphosphatase